MKVSRDIELNGQLIPSSISQADISSLEALNLPQGAGLYDGTEWRKRNSNGVYEPWTMLSQLGGLSSYSDGDFVAWDATNQEFILTSGFTASNVQYNNLDSFNDGVYSIPNYFVRATTNGGTDNTINRNVVTQTQVSFGGGLQIMPGAIGDYFTNGNATFFNTAFNGFVLAQYNMPIFSTGIRPSLRVAIQRRRAGVDDEFAASFSYIRNGGQVRDNLSGSSIIDCQPNDEWRLVYRRDGTNGTAVTIDEVAEFSLILLARENP